MIGKVFTITIIQNIPINGKLLIIEDCSFEFHPHKILLKAKIFGKCSDKFSYVNAFNARVYNTWTIINNDWIETTENTNPLYIGNLEGDLVIILSDKCNVSDSIYIENKNILRIYPNPASDYINFEFFGSKEQNVRIKIYNILGQIVKTTHVSKLEDGLNMIEVITEHIPEGIYFLIFESGCIYHIEKFEIISK